MHKAFIILLLTGVIKNTQAAFSTCGEYELNGTLHRENGIFYLLINEKTKSEIKTIIPESGWPTIAPYTNLEVSIIAKIKKKITGYNGELDEVIKIKRNIPNYLNQANIDGMKFLKKIECNK